MENDIARKRKEKEEEVKKWGKRRQKTVYFFCLEIQNDNPLSITQRTEKVSLKNSQPRITS